LPKEVAAQERRPPGCRRLERPQVGQLELLVLDTITSWLWSSVMTVAESHSKLFEVKLSRQKYGTFLVNMRMNKTKNIFPISCSSVLIFKMIKLMFGFKN
jgi:hypothetical protein